MSVKGRPTHSIFFTPSSHRSILESGRFGVCSYTTTIDSLTIPMGPESPTTTFQDIPPELLPLIFAHFGTPLHNTGIINAFSEDRALRMRGRENLLSCSLVCRRWRVAVVPMLFSWIILDFNDGDEAWLTTPASQAGYPEATEIVKKKLSSLLHFAHSTPWILIFVRPLDQMRRPTGPRVDTNAPIRTTRRFARVPMPPTTAL